MCERRPSPYWKTIGIVAEAEETKEERSENEEASVRERTTVMIMTRREEKVRLVKKWE